MKKTTIALMVIGTIVLASCKKDRTCECTYTSVSTSGSSSYTNTYTETIKYAKIKKGAAKDVCAKRTSDVMNSSSTSTTTTDSNITWDCKLK